MALSSRSSLDLVRDLGYERKGRKGREREREVGELALVGSLDRWIVEREEGRSAEEISTHSLLFWW